MWSNALAESIIGLYKTEVIDHLGPWETPAQVEAATAEWASWYNTRRVMRRTGGRPPAGYEQAWRDGTLGQVPARGPGSRPRRARRRSRRRRRWPPLVTLAGSARTRRGAAPDPGPPQRCPRQVTAGTPAAGHLLAGRVRGAAEPPPRSRAPPASQAMTLRVTLDLPGEPAAQSQGARRGDAQAPEGRPGGLRPAWRGSWTAQLDRCSIKQERKMIRPAVPSGGGTVEDNGHPDESIWGESSLHQTRGDPITLDAGHARDITCSWTPTPSWTSSISTARGPRSRSPPTPSCASRAVPTPCPY